MSGSTTYSLPMLVLLVLVLLHPAVAQVPTVTTTQTSYSVNQGATVTIGCNVQSTTTVTTVFWQRNVGGFITTINVAGNPNKYSGGSPTTPSLTIANAADDDSGIYTCYAANAFGTATSALSDLAVIIPNAPTITVSQGSYSVQTGNSVTLGCSVSSATTVTDVYWQRTVGNTVTVIRSSTNVNKYQGASVGTPSLTILNSDSGDSGNYVCYAVNTAGTSRSPTTTLSVTSNTLPTVSITQNTYTANGGSSVTLGCSISSSTTITDVYWTRTAGGTVTTIRSNTNPSKYIGATSGVPSITISNLNSNDAGNYVCFGTNSVGTSQSNVVTLTVNNLPTVTVSQTSYSVNSGSTIQLVCSVSSTTTVNTVFWTRVVGGSSTTIFSTTNTNKYQGSTPSVPSLTILNADSSDAGTYTCSATNAAGTGQSSQTILTVNQLTLPTVTISQNAYTVNSGSSITLGCSISSTTTITDVYWRKTVGGTFTDIRSSTNPTKYTGVVSGNPSLTISNLESNDAGNYVCYGTNNAGTAQSGTTTLTVISQSVPSVSLSQSSYSVLAGGSIQLTCTVSSTLSVTSVYWQRNVGGTITRIDSTTNINKYSGSTPTTPSLTILNAAQSDAGTYQCFATNSVGTGQSPTTTALTVSSVPTVQVLQNSYSGSGGSNIVLQCTVSSSSSSVTGVYWQRNVGGTITRIDSNTNINKYSGSTVSTPSLTINNLDASDAGLYTCFATNNAGTGQSFAITLTVFSNPPTVTVAQSAYSVTTGQSVTLVCTVTSSTQVTNVFWQRNVGGSVTTIQSNSNTNKYTGGTVGTPSLTILNAAQSDAGQYTCFASNSAGTGQSAPTTLSLTGSPPSVTIPSPIYSTTIGQSVTLTCSVSSTLTVNSVYWQRTAANGNSFTIFSTTNPAKYTGSTPSNPSLTISNADSNDAGTYTCFATNTAGTGQSTTTSLSVTGSPPTVTVAQPSYSVTTGQSVTLVCTVTSTLSVNTVYWMRNVGGSITTIQSNSNTNKYTGGTVATPSLTILSSVQSDVGSYTCLASNSVGTGQSSATTLSVTGNIPIVRVIESQYSVNIGKSGTLGCTVTANPAHTTVYWKRIIGGVSSQITIDDVKYSGSTVGTPSLTINNAANSDEGFYVCFATNTIGTGQSANTYLVVGTICKVNIDRYGTMWNQTFQMTTIEIQCTDHTGVAKRTCGSDGQWGEPDYSNCIRSDLIDLNTKLQNMVNKTVSPEETYEIVVEFENITKADNLLSGDLQYSADILNDVADSVANTNASTPYDILQPFVNSCDNLLQEINNPAWLELKTLDLKGITQLAKSVPVFLTGYNKQSNASFERIVERKNIVVQTGRSVPRTIVFPNMSHPSLTSVPTRVVLTNESVKENQMFGYSFVYYKNVSDLFHDYRLLKGQSVANSNDFVVNSAVVDVSLDPKPERLKAPLSIEFSHSKSGYNKPDCVFWDFNARNTPNGAWSTVGADLVNTSTKSTTCYFYHTTNFAIIMSTSRTPDIHAKALSIISLIGCGVSIGFLIITIVVYSLLWRYITRDKRGHIKRDSAITLMNFCVALILSYAVFLAGINRTENKKICTGIAVILHYLFLVDFSVMLMFGIEMAMSVLFVMTTFSTGSKIKLMCIAAWGVPALIVGTTMALKLDGYGTSEYCWLAIESSYLIWAFIGPALLVILINIVILILVLRTILSTEKLRRMSSKDQTKTTFRNICIILPVFGTTWVFGALSINEDTIMFQYLFAIFNSLQGFFVFLFHCCLSKNIHEAVRSSRESKGTSYIYSENNKGSTLEFSKDGGSTSDTFQTSEATDLSEIDLSKTSNSNKTKKKSKENAYDNRIQWASTSPEVSYSAKQRGKRYLY